MELIKGIVKSPYKIDIFGRPGIGKSSLAALSESPLILDLEGGVDRIDCVKTPLITRWGELYDKSKENPGILNQLCRSGKVFGYSPKTVIFDTTTALEKLIDPVATANYNRTNNKDYANLEQIDYGKGSGQLQAMVSLVLDLADVMKAKGISTIFVSHDTIEKVQTPGGVDYDQFTIQSMHKKVREVYVDRCDAVLYCMMDGTIVAKDKGFGNTKNVNIQSGERIMKCLGGTGYVAKNRFNLPNQVNMSPEIFSQLI